MSKESKHVTKFRETHLKPNEIIVEACEGYIGDMMGKGDKSQNNGTLIVTSERVVFYRKGMFGEVIQTMPLQSLTSVERKSMMGHRVIKLHTANDSLDFKTFVKGKDQAVMDAIEQGRHAKTESATKVADQASSLSTTDPTVVLLKLAELRDAGVLSNEEFEAKKREILERL